LLFQKAEEFLSFNYS